MKTTNSFLDKILPQFGNPRENIPVYSDSQKMFMSSHYTSASGNMYYKGLRFTDRMVMIEKVGLYKNFSYIDSVEVYAFDGETKILIGKIDYDKVFYNTERIKEDTATIIANYLEDSSRVTGALMDKVRIQQQTRQLLEAMYENPLRSAMALKGVYKQLLLNE